MKLIDGELKPLLNKSIYYGLVLEAIAGVESTLMRLEST